MSGPMALEPGAAEGDTLSFRLAEDLTLALRLPDQGPAHDAVDRLAAELADHVGPAVHPYEVAALLESGGTDPWR